MSEKRKDSKGRILRVGEYERENGSYEYKYKDVHNKRQSTYAKALDELRKKEAVISRDIADGIDFAAGEMTVSELVDKYINLKRSLKQNSVRAYSTAINHIHADAFGECRIKAVKLSDAKAWYLSLHDRGLKRNTIGIIHNIIRPAFEMAVDDDVLRKNPFKFRIADIIQDDAYKRSALSEQQQEKYLQFIREHGSGNYYNDIVALLGTGLRVSELYGLTKADVDLEKHCIYVRRQLCRTAAKPYFVTTPKTKSGIRCIPLTSSAYQAFSCAVKERSTPKIETMIDGCSGFLFLDKDEKPKVAIHLENYMRCMRRKYIELYGDIFPHVTPHVLRHTFCTNAQRAGLDVKSLQYLMGHSNVSVTLDVYSHTDYEAVEKAFERVAASL